MNEGETLDRALVVLRELVNAVGDEPVIDDAPRVQVAIDAAAEFLASVGVQPFDPFEQENEP